MKKPDMEAMFATLKELPEDFKENCMKYALPAPLYYRRKGKYADCRCGACNSIYITDEVPERGKETKCHVCGVPAKYAWMKETRPKQTYYTVVLIQRRTDDNLAIRHFKCRSVYMLGVKRYFSMTEETRYMLELGDFYKFNHIWRGKWGTGNNGTTWEDYLYPGWKEEVKESKFKYCNVQGHAPVALRTYARNPGIEMFIKLGLKELSRELVMYEGRSKYINRRGKDLKKQLRLKDKEKIKELIKEDGGFSKLRALQFEEKNKLRLQKDQRKWLKEVCDSWRGEEQIKHIMQYMTFQKAYNRIRKYQEIEKGTGKNRSEWSVLHILTEYDDYLSMREELGYDMTNEVYLYPKNLKQKHDQMVKEKNERKDELHMQKQEEKFNRIRKRFDSLERKYGFAADGYLIRPAESASEIITEGRMLHHCVGTEKYLDQHNKGTSYILLLRKAEYPESPYYTIEIRGEKILQWYGIRDTKPDKEEIETWLNAYVEHLKKGRMEKAG